MTGSAFYVDRADKELSEVAKVSRHLRASGSRFGLDIREASCGKQNADTFAHLVAVKRLARLSAGSFAAGGRDPVTPGISIRRIVRPA